MVILEGVAVVGDEYREAVSFPLPLLVALYALVAIAFPSGVVGVDETSDRSGYGSASLFVVMVSSW